MTANEEATAMPVDERDLARKDLAERFAHRDELREGSVRALAEELKMVAWNEDRYRERDRHQAALAAKIRDEDAVFDVDFDAGTGEVVGVPDAAITAANYVMETLDAVTGERDKLRDHSRCRHHDGTCSDIVAANEQLGEEVGRLRAALQASTRARGLRGGNDEADEGMGWVDAVKWFATRAWRYFGTWPDPPTVDSSPEAQLRRVAARLRALEERREPGGT